MFGLTQAMALGVIAFGSIWPIMLATIHGFAAVEPRLSRWRARCSLSRWAGIVEDLRCPRPAPDILAGMRLSLTVALILAVVCEILAGLDGLGHWVLLAARALSLGRPVRRRHPARPDRRRRERGFIHAFNLERRLLGVARPDRLCAALLLRCDARSERSRNASPMLASRASCRPC